MPKKRMPVGESRQETTTLVAAPPSSRCWITGRIPGRGAGASKGALTWAGELGSDAEHIRRHRRASWTPHGERTSGRCPVLGRHRLAGPRGQRTAAAAADLHGGAGRGPGQAQEPAEVDAAELEQHVVERAAGDAAQCWS